MEILRRYIFVIFLVLMASAQEPIVKEIGISGNFHFDDEEIIDFISTGQLTFWSSFSHWLLGNAPRLNNFIFKQDVTKIRDMYRSQGFLDVDVKANVKKVDNKNQVWINIFISEGERYAIQSVNISGDDSLFYSGFANKLSLRKGEFFNPSLVDDDRRKLAILGQNRGYPYIAISFDVDTIPPDSIGISFDIDQGKFAWFGNINYRSNTGQTDTTVLKREIRIHAGEPYYYDSILVSKENLYQTGLFDIVRIKPDSLHKKPDTIDMTINVFEKKANWVGAKLGLITETSFDMQTDMSIEYGNRNLLGRGRTIAGRAITSFSMINEWDNLKNRFELEYTDPWVAKKKLPVTLDLHYEPKNASLTEAYVVRRYGGRLTAKYHQMENTQHLLSTSLTKVDLLDVPLDGDGDTLDLELTHEIETVERNISYAFEFDTRDNILNPSTGSTFRFTDQFAGWLLGGDEHYNKMEIFWAQYHNVLKNSTFAWRFNIGDIFQLKEDNPVALHNRFFLGGSNTIRGFHESSMGPQSDDGTPSGGNFYMNSTMELRMPIVWIINWQAFVDVGQLWDKIDNTSIEEIQGSAGLGISLTTPFGPIRFDYGFQVLNPEDDYDKSWHLSILYAF